MHAPATLDGGDVLRIGERVFVGISEPHERGRRRRARGVPGPPLHPRARGAVPAPEDRRDAVRPPQRAPEPGVDRRRGPFREYTIEEAEDPNVVYLPGRLIEPESTDISEFAKADGSLTCLSLFLT